MKRDNNSEGWTGEATQKSFLYFKVFNYFTWQYKDKVLHNSMI